MSRGIATVTHFDRIKTPTLDVNALELSSSDPNGFRLHYGDYFVSGGLQRSEFHAVYQMTASKREDLLKFKAAASASSEGVFSADGSVGFTQAATANHVSISATVYHSASKSSPSLGSTPNLTPADVLKMFNQFQADRQDSWVVAELTHYSALAPKLSRVVPGSLPLSLGTAPSSSAPKSPTGGSWTRDCFPAMPRHRSSHARPRSMRR